MKIDFWFSKGQFFLSMCVKLFCTIGVWLALSGCGEHNSSVIKSSPQAVKVAEVLALDYDSRVFAGMATADDAVNLAFKISGQVLSVDVSKGDYVDKDMVLSRLNPRDVELQVAADRSQYEQAKSQYERAERLSQRQAVSQQEYEAAKAAYARARSVYENSKDLLLETQLKAPFAGVVERVYVDAFQRVESGEKILRLVNPLSTTVEFTIPEKSMPLLSDTTTTFSVVFDNIPNRRFDARMHKFAKTASDASGFPVALKIPVDEARRYRLSPGMTCQISMHTDGQSDGVAVPLTAIYAPAEGGEYVWVVVGDTTVRQQPVVLGNPFGQAMVQVLKGVAVGEKVVTAGVYRLQEGRRVKILNE